MAYGPRNVRFSFTGKNLTHFGGFYLVQHFFQRLHLRHALGQALRLEQRNNRYSTSELVLALLYPMLVGLGRIDASGILKRNGVFRYLTGLKRYPDATTLRRFLLRFGHEGLKAFMHFHDTLRTRMLSTPSTVVLDLDTTVLTVYGRQQQSAVGYNPKKRGRPSYHPLLCFEGRTADFWEGSFYPGNVHPAPVTAELLEKAFAKLPRSVNEIRVRADSAFYSHEILNFLHARKAFYAIAVRLTPHMKTLLAGLRFHRACGEVFTSEFTHQPVHCDEPQRFVVIRRPAPEEASWQLSLFQMRGYTYQVLVTNLDLTAYHLWHFYNARATAELIIRELKEAYALGKIPSHCWEANVAYFHLVGFAYNLLNWWKRFCLPSPFNRRSLQTIRRDLLAIPGELVRPHGVATIRLPASYPYRDVFNKILKQTSRVKLPTLEEL